jgi:protein-S-isoprenylcysteine O-methyltransferase Ste14
MIEFPAVWWIFSAALVLLIIFSLILTVSGGFESGRLWYLLWGAIYSLLMIPLIVVIVVFQALIEERYILEVKFGNEYNEFRKNVGMLIPRIKIQTQKKADKTG